MLGGVIVNVILAIVIFIGITWHWGEEYLPVKNIKQGLVVDSLAKTIGIQDGDNVVGIDGKPLEVFGTLEAEMVLNDAKVLQVTRNDSAFDVQVPAGFNAKLAKVANETSLVMPRYPAIVDSVSSTAVFTKDALKKNDQLLAINNKPFLFYHEFDQLKKGYEDSIVSLTVLRGADTVDVRVKINEKGKLGFFGRSPLKIFGTKTQTYGFMESIPVGFTKTWETLDRYVTGIKQIFTGKVNASESLGSVISIGNTFPGVWDWQKFWTLTGIFSIILAFMNILPIPALDGGHALFTLYEMITGRKPGDKFMEYAQMVGMILLLGLMAYALGLDFWRLFK
jgi:regulator of sigma E protease